MTGGRDERNRPDGKSIAADRWRRPRWMSFFAVVMFLVGANVFIGSLSDSYRLATGKARVLTLDGGGDPQQEEFLRSQTVLDNQLFRYKPKVMAAHTAGRLIVGLTFLFAVAAVVARDARGRKACMLAGWVGLVASMGHAAFLVLWVRRALPWVLPRLVDALTEDAHRLGRPVPTVAEVSQQAHMLLVAAPVGMCGLGMVFSLALLAYFSGRRMRRFYEYSGQVHG